MINTRVAAELLDVSNKTIRAMLLDGRLPGIVIRSTKRASFVY